MINQTVSTAKKKKKHNKKSINHPKSELDFLISTKSLVKKMLTQEPPKFFSQSATS